MEYNQNCRQAIPGGHLQNNKHKISRPTDLQWIEGCSLNNDLEKRILSRRVERGNYLPKGFIHTYIHNCTSERFTINWKVFSKQWSRKTNFK